MSHRVLVVEPERTSVLLVEQALLGIGYRVSVVSTFEQALGEIAEDCPDLLIAAIRLGAYNGFHLVLRCRALYPQMPSFVIGLPTDGQSEAERLGIKYVVKPVEPSALLGSVSELLAGRPPHQGKPHRRWPRKPAHLPATVSDASVEVVDLSYGGLRLEGAPILAVGVGGPIQVQFPTLGLSVTAVPRWTKPTDAGASWWYGAEVQPTGFNAARRWRTLVDSVH